MQAIDGLGVRCLPSRSASTHAKSTRASADKIFDSRAKDTHSVTRASAVPTKELSAQLARLSCGVIGVGSCYPVSHSEQTTKISSVRPRIAQGLASLRKSIVRCYSDIDNLCRSDGGNASCSTGIFDKLNTHLLGTYSAETLQRQEGSSVLAAPPSVLPLIYNMKKQNVLQPPSSKQVSGL